MIKRWVLKILKGYQRRISPSYQPCCRFTPTCSQYAVEAVEEWGVIRGLILAIWRVLRCNPLFRSGYDPVPVRHRKGER